MRTTIKLLLAVLMAVGAATTVHAINPDTVAMSVTVTTTKDVTITDDPLTFNSVAAGSSALSTTAATVSNSGSTTQSYRLQLTDKPAAWSVEELAGAPGNEEIKLLALFTTSTPPVTGDFSDAEDVVKLSGVTDATASVYAKNTEGTDAKGVSCTAGAVRKLWFKFMAPSSTIVSGVQWLTVTVTAF